MVNKKTIPVLLYGQIRGLTALNRFYDQFLKSEKYDYEFYLAGWNCDLVNQIKLPFKKKILVNEKQYKQEFRELTLRRIDGYDCSLDVTAARQAFHIKNLGIISKEYIKTNQFVLVCRVDYFLNIKQLEKHLDELYDSDINLLDKDFISLNSGLTVYKYFQVPSDGFFIANNNAILKMFDMYDNVFTHNKLKDVKIRPCTGPHQTFANYIVEFKINVITNKIEVMLDEPLNRR